jgi:uncharacterized membrane protein YdbT with pleckstrin-like domain
MRKYLLTGETLVYRANLHWIVFLKPAVVVAPALLFAVSGNFILPEFAVSFLPSSLLSFRYFGLDAIRLTGLALLVFGGIPTAVPPLLRRMTSEFWVSNKRVLVKSGFIKRNSFEIMLKKIEGIAVDQSILGRILNYGSIGIVGTGSSKESFHLIQGPLEFRRQVQEQIDIL